MPQHVFIQTDSPAPGLAKQSAVKADKAQSEAFAAELNKYTQPEQKSNTDKVETHQVQQATQETEAATQPEKNTVDDGNNLPQEETVTDSDNIDEPDVGTDIAEQSDQQQAETAEQEVSVDVVTVATDESVSDNSEADGSETAIPVSVNSQAETKDKPVRAQVTVSQNAVDNAKAAPVEMTARNKPEASQKIVEQTPVADKTVAADIKQTKVVVSHDKPDIMQPVKVDKLLGEDVSKPKSGQPNLAAVLEAKGNSESKPLSIRADILDALQRKSGDKEVSMNLRNMISAQLQEQTDKPDITKALLTAERGGHENKAANVATSFSPLTAASSSTSGTIPTTASQGLSLPVQPGLQNPAWSQVMSSRVVWMAKEGVHQAELRMTPANLGPVEVRLQLQNEQASVTFMAQHAATRDALEQALPRLRESFAEAGIELGHAEVSEQQHQQENEAEHADDSHNFSQASVVSDDIESEQEIEPLPGETTAGLSIYA